MADLLKTEEMDRIACFKGSYRYFGNCIVLENQLLSSFASPSDSFFDWSVFDMLCEIPDIIDRAQEIREQILFGYFDFLGDVEERVFGTDRIVHYASSPLGARIYKLERRLGIEHISSN